MWKPLTLALAASLLAMPLACGDDDDTGGTDSGGSAGEAGADSGGSGGSSGSGGKGGSGGSSGSLSTEGGMAGDTAQGGVSPGTAGEAGSPSMGGAGGAGEGGAGEGGAGEGGAGEGGATAGAPGVAGAAGDGAGGDGGAGGAAPDLTAQIAESAAEICETAAAANCSNQAGCVPYYTDVPGDCIEERDALNTCYAAEITDYTCNGDEIPEPADPTPCLAELFGLAGCTEGGGA